MRQLVKIVRGYYDEHAWRSSNIGGKYCIFGSLIGYNLNCSSVFCSFSLDIYIDLAIIETSSDLKTNIVMAITSQFNG